MGTYQQGKEVYFDIHYADPGNDTVGFGFMGVNGARRVAETHPFSAPNRGIGDSDSVAYPLDLKCGTPGQHGAEIEAWIYDTAGASSPAVAIRLACGA